jgi:nucleotide-binding universal stress UspA family protein
MLAIHTILHPTDFSDRSDFAFRVACALARDYGARLVLLHVVAPPVVVYGEGVVPPQPEYWQERLTEQLHRLEPPAPNGRAEHILKEGDAVTEILGTARAVGADLIVMGTHGRTGLARLLMGSVAEQVVRRAACPVLTVRMPLGQAVPAGELLAEPAGA